MKTPLQEVSGFAADVRGGNVEEEILIDNIRIRGTEGNHHHFTTPFTVEETSKLYFCIHS